MPLNHTLTMGHFRPESVSVPGSLQDAELTQSIQKRSWVPPVEARGGTDIPPNSNRQRQEEVENPLPIPYLQVGPSFKIRLSMYLLKENTG